MIETTMHREQVNSMNKTKQPTFQVGNRLLLFQGKQQENYIKYRYIKSKLW